MKKTFSTVLCSVILAFSVFAGTDTDLHYRIINTTEASEPTITSGTLLLTYNASSGTQSVSLAFEHENFKVFHNYEKNKNGIFILTLPAPSKGRELHYRLIVDGLWTTDPNARNILDSRGIRVSTIRIARTNDAPDPGIHTDQNGITQFVFKGEPDSRISLVGDFNRWDPFLTPLEESPVYPGVYSIKIAIPTSSRYYRYVVNGEEITDPANTVIVRNGWGEPASPLY